MTERSASRIWLMLAGLSLGVLVLLGMEGAEWSRERSRSRNYLTFIERSLARDVAVLDSVAQALDVEVQGARRFIDWADEQIDAGSASLVAVLQDLVEPTGLDLQDEGFRDLIATGRAGRIPDAALRTDLMVYYDEADRYESVGRQAHERFVQGLETRLDRGLWLIVFGLEPDEAMAVDYRVNVQRLANEGGTEELRGVFRGWTARRALVGRLRARADDLLGRIARLREGGR